jgi:death-associated protein kinase
MSSLEEFAKAIDDGDSVMVWSLVSRGSVDVDARLPRKCQPPALVHAAGRGQREIVDILLRANARVNEADERGWTACHAAAARCDDTVLALLLARQPNLAAIDADGKTALLRAMTSYYVDDRRCTVMLLEAGASLDAVGHDDLCGLAATSTAAIQALINRGVNLRELVDRDGGTPLHSAARRKWDLSDVFDMLGRVCGIDLEARDRFGQSCALVAVQCDNVFALRWLIKADVDVDFLSSDGSNSLCFVPECAVALIAAGVDACARDKLGRTALHHALAVVPTITTTSCITATCMCC